MRKAIMTVSLTAFAAVAAFAAPRNVDVLTSSSSKDEVSILPIDDQSTISSIRPVDEKPQNCPCNKGKKGKK